MSDDDNYYPEKDFDDDVSDEQQNQASGSSRNSDENSYPLPTVRRLSNFQTTLSYAERPLDNKGKKANVPILSNLNKYKRKKPSFTQEYFEKKVNEKGEFRICNILDKGGKKCGQEYKISGSSTGNLIAHLRDKHDIISQDENIVSKKSRNSKITDFARSHRPYPKHIQKRREETTLKWMLLTNQPLSAVTNDAYKEKMAEFDSPFVVPGEKKIRTMISKSYQYNRQNLQNLLTITDSNVSLTTDLWSSRAKHGYLGVTVTWITPNFEIKDTMLEIKYVPSLHTSEVIANELHKCIETWKLENHVTSITTDNGPNMVSAFPLLNKKNGCENIQRLPCTAHTLQLVVGKGLAPAEILVIRAKRLIQFFRYQKQVERLEDVQRKLGYTDIMRCIQDVPTRWNSTYYAWDRLYFLKDAITQLQTDLFTSTDQEIKKDGKKLKKFLLSDDEWELLNQLIDLLLPFEELTRELSGNTYVTLSQVIPTIKEMIFDLASERLMSDEFLNEDTVFGSDSAEIPNLDDDDEVVSNITKKKISIKNPLNTTGVLEKVRQNLYSTLIYYWDFQNEIGLMAALLDPRYKSLDFLEDDILKQQIIQTLRDEYKEIGCDPEPQNDQTLLNINEGSSTRSHKVYRQQRKIKNKKVVQSTIIYDELTNYLSLPVALETENPLDWWRLRLQNFPKLSKIARKYLAIPATSVSSERLFSDAGNLISAKRINLDTNLVGRMLFLKRNMKTMEVFAPEWDDENEGNIDETDYIEIN